MSDAPLYQLDAAPVERPADLALVVLDAAGGSLLIGELQERVNAVADALDVEFSDESEEFQYDILGLLYGCEYLSTPFRAETVTLRERGEQGAQALRASLTDGERGVLGEVSEV